jgi:hypothetical protein
MVTARRQLIPWRAAGTRAEMRRNADEVVRDTGWVFNNQTGASLTLEEFVQTGDAEVDVYLDRLGWNSFASGATMLEIGSGIGRMTSAFSRKFAVTVATDVDAAFLERCRETVSRFGRVGFEVEGQEVVENDWFVAGYETPTTVSFLVMRHQQHDNISSTCQTGVSTGKQVHTSTLQRKHHKSHDRE